MREHTGAGGVRGAGRKISIAMMCCAALVIGEAVFTTTGVVAANMGDPMRGKTLFEKRCGGCHSLEQDKEGPRLHDVYGRKAGSVPTFRYSDSLKAAGFTWDAGLLNKWLTDTESVVPDNNMDFRVPTADERADIIEFLRVSAAK